MTSWLTLLAVVYSASNLAGQVNKDDPKAAAVGKMVHYSGKVQGVGFRATVAAIAKKFAVSGWVKNLADGRVQLLVEGPPKEVDAFLEAVRARWKDNIEKEQVQEQPAAGKYKGFEIEKGS